MLTVSVRCLLRSISARNQPSVSARVRGSGMAGVRCGEWVVLAGKGDVQREALMAKR